jgi:hypothetical protein
MRRFTLASNSSKEHSFGVKSSAPPSKLASVVSTEPMSDRKVIGVCSP